MPWLFLDDCEAYSAYVLRILRVDHPFGGYYASDILAAVVHTMYCAMVKHTGEFGTVKILFE